MARLKHRIAFYNALATLEEAGVPPLRGLQQRQPGAFRQGALDLQAGVKQGLTVSQAMARLPGLFSALEVRLVEVGEATGRRDAVYRALRDWFQLVWRLRSRVIGALLYPAFVYHAAALLIPFISVLVEGVSPGRALAQGIGFLAAPWVCWLAGGVLVRWVPEVPGLGRALLAVPVLGGLLFRLDCTRFFTALGLCLRAGGGMAAAVATAAATCRNSALRQRFAGAAREMAREGCSFTAALEGAVLSLDRDTMIMELMRTGEEAGRADEAAERIAALCRDEAEARLNQIAVLAPNVAYLVLVAYIGYRIVSFYGHHYGFMRELLNE